MHGFMFNSWKYGIFFSRFLIFEIFKIVFFNRQDKRALHVNNSPSIYKENVKDELSNSYIDKKYFCFYTELIFNVKHYRFSIQPYTIHEIDSMKSV